MDRSRSRPSEVWRTDHPSDRQGGPIPRDRSSLHKQDVFNDFEAYELKLAVSRLSLNNGGGSVGMWCLPMASGPLAVPRCCCKTT